MRFSEEAKREHLRLFQEACFHYATVLAGTDQHSDDARRYFDIASAAQALLGSGFTQEDLSSLSRDTRVIYACFPHWTPPMTVDDNGRCRVPEWYPPIGEAESRLLEAKGRLRQVGVVT